MRISTYLERRQIQLDPNYTEEDNVTQAHCGSIAYEAASILLRNGFQPHIRKVKPAQDKRGVPTKTLNPKQYNGVTFYAHFFAATEDTAYDPILGEPVTLPSYTEAVFQDNSLESRICATTSQIIDELKR